MKLHPSITTARLMRLVAEAETTLSNPGICKNCGTEASGCEPDARNYFCDECQTYAVDGAEELLFSAVL